MVKIGQTWRLDSETMTLAFIAHSPSNIDVAYMGPLLPIGEDIFASAHAGQFGGHENEPDVAPIAGLLPQNGGGYGGRPAFQFTAEGEMLKTDLKIEQVESLENEIRIDWVDYRSGFKVQLNWRIVGDRLIEISTRVTNKKETDILLLSAATACVPMPSHYAEVTMFPGRWAREMQETKIPIGQYAIELRSANGKPGFDAGNWLVFHSSKDDSCLGFHSSSYGDHATHIARDQNGQVSVAAEALVQPSGILLRSGHSLDLNKVILAYAKDQDHLTRLFHAHVRKQVLPERTEWGPRKVHLNSWEALGFGLNEDKCLALASSAAALGVERFVLDDGWFKGRRSDTSSLGDWNVDQSVFPNGLQPLIDHIHSLEMDFGLWVEPEMVSPDSDLYRAHPDWCLHEKDSDRPTERNQLVLDLSRDEVFSFLQNSIFNLLDRYDIAYLKWDHNRRLFPDNGVQQFAIEKLLRSIKSKYPRLEIESCASGGGRVSFSILEHCHRVWPSDNNDPIERLRIMDSWTRFLPLEVLGNHVGPSPNPITSRQTHMDFRAKTALFGHMGVEANPADMSISEREVLSAHIAIYKDWRDVLHHGAFYRLDCQEKSLFGQIVVHEGRALAMAAQTSFAQYFDAKPICLKGLDAQSFYAVKLLEPWPQKASAYLDKGQSWKDGRVLSGQFLSEHGVALPLTHPETAWLIAIEQTLTEED